MRTCSICLDSDVYQQVMVFVNTKDMTQRLCKRLKDAGYPAECLHGDMRQSVRNEVMQGFRKGKFQILLATDVAARGIDVDDVEAVINYDLPNENEYYLHRIGRTGRAKRHGVAFTLLTYTESVRFDEILKYIMAKPIPLHFDEMGILCKEDGRTFLRKHVIFVQQEGRNRESYLIQTFSKSTEAIDLWGSFLPAIWRSSAGRRTASFTLTAA